MNTINISTGFSPFQLRMGRSPRIIPPITQSVINDAAVEGDDALSALQLIHRLQLDVLEAHDNLFAAKVAQAEFAN
jgi:hypothetical protein